MHNSNKSSQLNVKKPWDNQGFIYVTLKRYLRFRSCTHVTLTHVFIINYYQRSVAVAVFESLATASSPGVPLVVSLAVAVCALGAG